MDVGGTDRVVFAGFDSQYGTQKAGDAGVPGNRDARFFLGVMHKLREAQPKGKLIFAWRNKSKGAGLMPNYGWAGKQPYTRYGNFAGSFAELAI